METNPCRAIGCRACCINIEGHSAISDTRFKKIYPDAHKVASIDELEKCKIGSDGVYFTIFRNWIYFVVNGVCPRQNGDGCDAHELSYYLSHCRNMQYGSAECEDSK